MTYGNGLKFACHVVVSKALLACGYFCHIYHFWEKGESYMIKAQMSWPMLKSKEISDFHAEYDYSERGILNLVLVDLSGEIIQGSYEEGKYVGPSKVLRKLESLFAE